MEQLRHDWQAEPQEQRFTLTVVPDIEGPRVRLGVVWFVVSVGAALVGAVWLALVLAGAAAAAAVEVVRTRGGGRPVRHRRPTVGEWVGGFLADRLVLPAALGAAALPLAALDGPSTLAAALPAVVVVVWFHRVLTPSDRGAIGDLASVLGAAFTFGLAAAGPVLLSGLGLAAPIVLLLLVCAYDAGDYLVGSENSNRWEGPVAGMAAVAVVAFAAAVVEVPPVSIEVAVAFGVLVAVAAPLGPPVAAVLAGSSRHRSRCVRRIDSLVVVGPLAYSVALLALG